LGGISGEGNGKQSERKGKGNRVDIGGYYTGRSKIPAIKKVRGLPGLFFNKKTLQQLAYF